MSDTLKKTLIIMMLLLIAFISFAFIGDITTDETTHERTVAMIDDKIDTVLKLTAASTVASAGISAIPGDTATPIAEKLADLTQYFLLVLCVLYSEKYLLAIVGAATFRILIPLACIALCAAVFFRPELMKKLAFKCIVFGLVIYMAIPMSIGVSDMIYNAYESSIDTTIDEAVTFSDEASALGEDEAMSVWDKIVGKASTVSDRAAGILNRYVEALAVMIVTSCIIPLLVLLFFIWIIKLLTGIDIKVPAMQKNRNRTEEHSR